MTITLDKQKRIKLSEAQIQKQCVELLRAEGWIVRPAPKEGYKASRGAHRVPAGEPDLIAVRWSAGRLGWIGKDEPPHWDVMMVECKTPDGRVSKDQTAWHAAHPFPVYLVRSVDELRAIPGVVIRIRAVGEGA